MKKLSEKLSWSHYLQLMIIQDKYKSNFYENSVSIRIGVFVN